MSNGHSTSNSSSYPCWCAPAPNCVAVVDSNATPASISEGILSAGGLEFNYFDILDVTIKCNADAVAQVTHFTPSGFEVGTCCGEQATYEIKLYNPTCLNENDIAPSTYSLTFDEDTTGALIVDAFVSLINGDENAFVTASDGGNTLILTADTAGCSFDVLYKSDNIAQLNFVASVAPFGSADQVTEDGGTPLTSSTEYHAVDILYRRFIDDSEQCSNCLRVCKELCRIYVIDSAAGDSFITSIGDVTDGTSTAADYLSKSSTLACA
jgi:hypothetical protein